MRDPTIDSFLGKAVSKAVLSERFAAWAYGQIAELSTSPTHIERALEDSAEESRHAACLVRLAEVEGLALTLSDEPDAQMAALFTAFQTLVDRGDRLACVYAQDILLEHAAIHLYEALLVGARRGGLVKLERLLRAILHEERAHVASAVEEIRADVPDAMERQRALQAALVALMPVLTEYGRVAPGTPCKQVCSTCAGRCCQMDAEVAGMPFEGGFDRMMTAVQGTLLKIAAPRAA